jgi:hypothetical protein
MRVEPKYDNVNRVRPFYSVSKNSLDIVLTGSSMIYMGWSPLYAYREYGITSYPYSTSSQPPAVLPYILNDIRKSQDGAVIVIDYSMFARDAVEFRESYIHFAANSMPFSLNKVDAIEAMIGFDGLQNELNPMDFLFDFSTYHSAWDSGEIFENIFTKKDEVYGSPLQERMLQSKPLKDLVIDTGLSLPLDAKLSESLDELISYLGEWDGEILFITMPHNLKETEVGRLNCIQDRLSSAGYSYLNLNDKFYDIGLDTSKDFADGNHLNYYGSLKTTAYLVKYIEDLGYALHAEDSDSKAFDKAYNTYVKAMKEMFDFEVTW